MTSRLGIVLREIILKSEGIVNIIETILPGNFSDAEKYGMELKNLKPVDSLGNAVEDEKFQCYIKNNIDKSRYKKHLEKNYNK